MTSLEIQQDTQNLEADAYKIGSWVFTLEDKVIVW